VQARNQGVDAEKKQEGSGGVALVNRRVYVERVRETMLGADLARGTPESTKNVTGSSVFETNPLERITDREELDFISGKAAVGYTPRWMALGCTCSSSHNLIAHNCPPGPPLSLTLTH
jgi:hypothetical protein